MSSYIRRGDIKRKARVGRIWCKMEYDDTKDDGKTRLVLDKDAYAAIWSPEDGYFFCVPKSDPDDPIPDRGLALIGALMRLDMDPEFLDECCNWVKEKRKVAS